VSRQSVYYLWRRRFSLARPCTHTAHQLIASMAAACCLNHASSTTLLRARARPATRGAGDGKGGTGRTRGRDGDRPPRRRRRRGWWWIPLDRRSITGAGRSRGISSRGPVRHGRGPARGRALPGPPQAAGPPAGVCAQSEKGGEAQVTAGLPTTARAGANKPPLTRVVLSPSAGIPPPPIIVAAPISKISSSCSYLRRLSLASYSSMRQPCVLCRYISVPVVLPGRVPDEAAFSGDGFSRHAERDSAEGLKFLDAIGTRNPSPRRRSHWAPGHVGTFRHPVPLSPRLRPTALEEICGRKRRKGISIFDLVRAL
jgi:hypothetical protein